MERYDDTTYGERIAEVYDTLFPEQEEDAVALLAELAAGGRVLELGIGTGRMALPLAARGLNVAGIDASPAMVDKLRAKPGGDEIRVVMGSFAEVPIEGSFDLIFVVFNTFFGLLTQEEQVRCFSNIPARLAEGGRFLMEAFVPDLARFEDHQTVRLVELSENTVRLDAAEHDIVKQHITSQHVLLSSEGIQLYPAKLRYAWPSELDLMAALAGLTLKERWGSWRRDPFTKSSTSHISVYGQPA